MLTTFFQENQIVEWDRRFIDRPIQLHDRIFMLFLVILFIVMLVIAGRLLFSLGLSHAKIRRRLDELVDQLATLNGPKLSQALAGVSSRALERGLKELVSVAPQDASAGLQPTLSRADALWRRDNAILHARNSTLFTVSVMAAFASCIYLAADLVYIFREIHLAKATPWRAVFAELSETMLGVGLGLLVSASAFIAYRYFLAHLSNRQAHWQFFLDRCASTLP